MPILTLNMTDSDESNTLPDTASTWLDQAEDFARREPAKAVVSAFGAGLLLNLLPIGALTAVAFALARPTLLCFGLLKVWELCPCKKNTTHNP